jgi:peptidoglycan/xylan/chitin deacetylase (PgdA/CDA1 family)
VRATFCGDVQRRNASPVIVRRARAEGHKLRDAFGSPKRGVVDPFDWKRPGYDELCRRVLGAVAPGKTVLLHAGVRDTVEALPYILQSLRKRGLVLEKT